MAKGIKKEKKLSWYKDKAWEAFSRFIRTRDCLATTNDAEWGICCTCKKRKHFKELQAGHYIPGRGSGILFEETCVHAQCAGCNKWGNRETKDAKGCPIAYEAFMKEKYGQEEIDRLYRLAVTSPKIDRIMYKAMQEHYEEETKKLLIVYRERDPILYAADLENQ